MILHREDFDNKIKEFVTKWEGSTCDVEESAIKKSLTYEITTQIYEYFRKRLFTSDNKYLRKRLLGRFRNLYEVIRHSFWYLPFCIKWIIFTLTSRDKSYILLSLLPDKKHSTNYITSILKNEKINNTTLIHFGMFYNWKLLFNSRFFCYPHFFYRLFFIKHDSSYKVIIEKKITENINDIFGIKCDIEIELSKKLLILNSFMFLINHILRKDKILFFIQDLDFMTNGYIYNYCCNQNNIKSIAIDHSILLMQNQFINRTSDYFLVWGQYQKNRLKEISKIKDESIIIIGHPDKSYKTKHIRNSKKKNWLYLMQGYQFAIVHMIGRTPQNTIENIRRLKESLNNISPDGKIIVKPHPLDKFTPQSIYHDYISYEKTDNLIQDIDIVFFEDTSSVFDCLVYPVKLVYISPRYCSNTSYRFTDLFETIFYEDNWTHKIHGIMSRSNDLTKRSDLYSCFYGNSEFYELHFKQSLSQILNN